MLFVSLFDIILSEVIINSHKDSFVLCITYLVKFNLAYVIFTVSRRVDNCVIISSFNNFSLESKTVISLFSAEIKLSFLDSSNFFIISSF